MIEVTVELVHTTITELADFRVLKNAVGVRTIREELADRRVGRDANRLVILNWDNGRSCKMRKINGC